MQPTAQQPLVAFLFSSLSLSVVSLQFEYDVKKSAKHKEIKGLNVLKSMDLMGVKWFSGDVYDLLGAYMTYRERIWLIGNVYDLLGAYMTYWECIWLIGCVYDLLEAYLTYAPFTLSGYPWVHHFFGLPRYSCYFMYTLPSLIVGGGVGSSPEIPNLGRW